MVFALKGLDLWSVLVVGKGPTGPKALLVVGPWNFSDFGLKK